MENYKEKRKGTLENEIVMAVVILYLLIAFIMIVIHYIQPADRTSATSSPPHINEPSVPASRVK